MFEQLFNKTSTIALHRNAPYAKEREQYLYHCQQQGYSHATILLYARELLWVAQKLSVYPSLQITISQIEAVANDWQQREQYCGHKLNAIWTSTRFIQVAKAWLRYLGFIKKNAEPTPFSEYLSEFIIWMKDERGLAITTIGHREGSIRQFLRWYGTKGKSFKSIVLSDIDAFLAKGTKNGWCRHSVRNMAMTLRAFFRFSAMRGWCPPKLAESIHGPRIFALEALPIGPSWPDVQRLLANVNTDQPCDIRNRAIFMLLSIYGFRESEVIQLRLDDIDWIHDLLHMFRAKRQSAQTFPLLPTVGNAIIKYLQEVRPGSNCRQLFLTLLPPYRPLSRGAIYSLTQRKFKALSIHATHNGPHSLRHACAAHLVSKGLSFKVIGDQLGHRSTMATRIYAKVDLPTLRKVASFDLGDLL